MSAAESSSATYPLTFVPEFRNYIWGGRRLETLFGRVLPPGIVAESWEISGHPDSPTRIAAGRWRGHTLPEVMAKMGADLVGSHSAAMLARGRFPLLIKLLDANQDLSVQVHPDNAYAAAHEGGEIGKSEMWYVLYAEPGYEIIHGVRPGVTRDSFRAAIDRGQVAAVLNRVPVSAGDAVDVPAGTVHALLAGAVVAEIQQTSDLTYRVYDWDRLGRDGKPRALHIARALDVIDFGPPPQTPVAPQVLGETDATRRELLVRRPAFTTERLILDPGATFQGCCDGSTFEIWGCLAGECSLNWAHGAMSMPAVGFVLLPATLGCYTIAPAGHTTLLRIYV